MNYDKIEKLIRLKRVPKMLFYESIGLTHAGFARMMKNKTISVETLEKIAQYFQVSITVFFDKTDRLDSEIETIVSEKDQLQQKVTELYEENRQLMKENKKLMEQNAALKESQDLRNVSHPRKLESKH